MRKTVADLSNAGLSGHDTAKRLEAMLDISLPTAIDLSGNGLDAPSFEAVSAVIRRRYEKEVVPTLSELKLNNVPLDWRSSSILSSLLSSNSVAQSLTYLSIASWRLSDRIPGVSSHSGHGLVSTTSGELKPLHRLMSDIRRCRSLTSLNMGQCSLQLDDLTLLSAIIPTSLQALILSHNIFAALTTYKTAQKSTTDTVAALASMPLPVGSDATADFDKQLADNLESARALLSSGIATASLNPHAVIFAASLASPSCCLRYLDISYSSLNDSAFLPIAHVLPSCASLQYLDVSGNQLTATSANALATALEACRSLTELRVGFQNLSLRGTEQLLQALRTNQSMLVLCAENTFHEVFSDEIPTNRPQSQSSTAPQTARAAMSRMSSASTSTAPLPRPSCLSSMQRLRTLVSSVLETRSQYCRVVLEYPERCVPEVDLFKILSLRGSLAAVTPRERTEATKHKRWSLEESVWNQRAHESDSKDYYDTPAVLGRAFESDWAQSKLHRVIKNPKTRAAIKPIIKEKYGYLRELFKYFAARSGDPFTLTFAQFTDLRKSLGMDAPGRSAELSLAFYGADAQGSDNLGTNDKRDEGSPVAETRKSPQLKPISTGWSAPAWSELKAASADEPATKPTSPSSAAMVVTDNPTNALTRNELLEAFVRLSLAFYRDLTAEKDTTSGAIAAALKDLEPDPDVDVGVVAAIKTAVDDNLVTSATSILGLPVGHADDAYSNLFRRLRMYSEDVDEVLRRFASVTQRVYRKRMDEMSGFLMLGSWMDMLGNLGVLDGSILSKCATVASESEDALPARKWDFSEKDGRLIFLFSIMTVVDEVHRATRLARLSTHTSLTYSGFLEALCRLADSPACPPSLPQDLPSSTRNATSRLSGKAEPSKAVVVPRLEIPSAGAAGAHDTTKPHTPSGGAKNMHVVKAGGAMVRRTVHAASSRPTKAGSATARDIKRTDTGQVHSGALSARVGSTPEQGDLVDAGSDTVALQGKPAVESAPQVQLPMRLEILLCHLAVSEHLNIQSIERKYV